MERNIEDDWFGRSLSVEERWRWVWKRCLLFWFSACDRSARSMFRILGLKQIVDLEVVDFILVIKHATEVLEACSDFFDLETQLELV